MEAAIESVADEQGVVSPESEQTVTQAFQAGMRAERFLQSTNKKHLFKGLTFKGCRPPNDSENLQEWEIVASGLLVRHPDWNWREILEELRIDGYAVTLPDDRVRLKGRPDTKRNGVEVKGIKEKCFPTLLNKLKRKIAGGR